MAVLPEEIPTGTLTGQFYFVNEDNIDADTNPELTVVRGFVRCVASVKTLRIASKKAVIIPLRFDAQFDSQGNLVPENGNGIGMEMPAVDSPLFDTTGWTWTATFELVEAETGFTVNLAPVPFQIFEGKVTDLSDLVPVEPSQGVITTRGEPGPVGLPGQDGLDGLDGSNVLPTNTAVANALREDGEAKTALNAAIAGSVGTTLDSRYARNIRSMGHILKDSMALGMFNAMNGTPTPSGESVLSIEGQNATVGFPLSGLDHRRPVTLVVHCQGDGGGYVPSSSFRPLMDAAVDAGFIVAISELHGPSFGGPEAMRDIQALVGKVAQMFPIRGVILSGESMGALPACNAVTNGIVDALGLFLVQPTLDLRVAYAAAPQYKHSIELAFGIDESGSDFEEKTYGYQPLDRKATDYRGTPLYVCASDDDSLVVRSVHADRLEELLAGHVPITHSNGSGNHGDISQFKSAEFLTFLWTTSSRLGG